MTDQENSRQHELRDYLPVHVFPVPVYPAPQLHSNDPGVLVQTYWQLSVPNPHSSSSEK